MNEDQNEKETQEKKEQSSSFTSDILGSGLLEVPLKLGANIIDSIKSKTTVPDNNLSENISDTLNSAKDLIGEQTDGLIEGVKAAGEIMGEITGNAANVIIDAVGEIINGIEL